MVSEKKGNPLENFVLFHNVPNELINKLDIQLKESFFEKDSTIFKEGSEGDNLYLIKSGSVKLSKSTKQSIDSVIGILHEGDFFGELELIDGLPRSATAVATTDSHLLMISKSDFYKLLSNSIELVENVLKTLSIRLRSINETFVMEFQRYIESVNSKIEKFNQLIEATKVVNSSLDLDEILSTVLSNAVVATNADRGTVYLIDEDKQELWSKVIQGEKTIEIRMPIGKGIAGQVAITGETVNISDPYNNPMFNPEIDKLTGYETKSILCMPLKNREGKIIGVFQLLNKHKGSFNQEDENFISAFSIHAAIAIENAKLVENMLINERLATVGKMASTIIHDIKNPLSTMRLYTQVLRNKVGTEETTKMADEIIRQIDRFISMTQEILDFARGEQITNIQEVKIDEYFDQLLNYIEKDYQNRNIVLTRNIQYKGTIKFDPDRISRVMYNLAGNAADAMPQGGKVDINVFQDDNFLKIEFVDTGKGIPADIKNKLFTPFFTYGKKHGTGLGLAIVKKIIDEHKGTINLESELDKGTKITIRLPIIA
ncbi:MAG: Adenylate cyclase [Ignavibacteriae bacterium]|nr:MAG: Adenylate cyclase [Ignavibacteriota bacterium]